MHSKCDSLMTGDHMTALDPNLERYQPTFYSVGDTARQLGVSVAMLRRYAKALESLLGPDAIQIDIQRGRLYTQAQVDLLKSARDYVHANPGSSVENALRLALGMEEVTHVRTPTPPPSEMELRRAVEDAVGVALTRAVAPLEHELAELRSEIKELRRDLAATAPQLPMFEPESQAQSDAVPTSQPSSLPHGVLVQLALRLEGFIRRFGARSDTRRAENGEV